MSLTINCNNEYPQINKKGGTNYLSLLFYYSTHGLIPARVTGLYASNFKCEVVVCRVCKCFFRTVAKC